MSDKWSADQVKEFFEQRAVDQERRLEALETSVGEISKSVSTMMVKVNGMWWLVGITMVAVIGALVKFLSGGEA